MNQTAVASLNSTMTVLKGHGCDGYDGRGREASREMGRDGDGQVRDHTPRVEIVRGGSSAKLIRVSSGKGINVLSVRAGSVEKQKQKQVRQFSSNTSINITPQNPSPSTSTNPSYISIGGQSPQVLHKKDEQALNTNSNTITSTHTTSNLNFNVQRSNNSYSTSNNINNSNGVQIYTVGGGNSYSNGNLSGNGDGFRYVYPSTTTNVNTSVNVNQSIRNYVGTSTNSNPNLTPASTPISTVASPIPPPQTYTKTQVQQLLAQTLQKYEQKMNKQLSYQYDFLTCEIKKLTVELESNQGRIEKQNFELEELFKRVQAIEGKIQGKVGNMGKQLGEFRGFYQQCYAYCLDRIASIQQSLQALTSHISTTTPTPTVQIWQYTEYLNTLLKSIVTKTSLHTSDLKYYLDDQIYQLEERLASYVDRFVEMDCAVVEMRGIVFGNLGVGDWVGGVREWIGGKNGEGKGGEKEDGNIKKAFQYYEQKYKQLKKSLSNSMIQIDLLQTLLKNPSPSPCQSHTQTIQSLQSQLATLEHRLQTEQQIHAQKIQQKQQMLTKSHPRILELETKLHAYYEQEIQFTKEISELRLKLGYCEVKLEKERFSEREFQIQSSLAQAFSETVIKEKIKVYVQEKQHLNQKIHQLQQKIKALDNENYLLAQKLSNASQSDSLRTENIKLEAQLKFLQKINENLTNNQKRLDKQLKQHRLQWEGRVIAEKEKSGKFEIEMEVREKEYTMKINMEREKYRAEIQGYKQQLTNQRHQIDSKQTTIQQLTTQNTTLTSQTQILTQQITNLTKQINSLQSNLQSAKQNQQNLSKLLSHQTTIKQDDQAYFQQLEEQVEKCYRQIEELREANERLGDRIGEVEARNRELEGKNMDLENDLISYAETFEKQSITFRNALANLSKEKEYVSSQYARIAQENKLLKVDLEKQISSRTALSFYQNNNSGVSIQLRKTMSTDLGENHAYFTTASTSKIPASPAKKLQRKGYSSINLNSDYIIQDSIKKTSITKKQTPPTFPPSPTKPTQIRSSIRTPTPTDTPKPDKLSKLKGTPSHNTEILQKLKYQLPAICEIDATGYLKDEKTGCYFMDQQENYFQLSGEEMGRAVRNGLILL